MSSRSGRALVAGVIALQFLVPIVALIWNPPNRFGFQMYSAAGSLGVVVVDASGETIDVNVREYLPIGLRNDLDYSDRLPPFLCQEVPGADAVLLTRRGETQSVPC